MRFIILVLALAVVGQVRANEYYYVVFNIPTLADVHFASQDAACQSAYQYDQSVTFKEWAGDNELTPLPYEAPHVFQSFPPKLLTYQCDTSAKVTYRDESGNITGTDTLTNGYYINRQGNDCKDGQYYNPVTGYCQTSDQEQPSKELGDPAHLVGTVSCADPINIGTGNVFEQETDYADDDGELGFSLTYNSLTGRWRHNYSVQAAIDSTSISLISADGRLTVFAIENGAAVAEPGEMGSMINSNGIWIYTSPSGEVMKFDMLRGRLIELTSSTGATQKISYVSDAALNTTATVIDSRGHKLTFKTNVAGQISQMVVGSLTVTYQFDASRRLISTARQWPNHTSTRGYLYEDTANPLKLTGIIDERGVRAATWAYDDQGRAVLNERAGGADKVSITYADDGSVVATNAMGQSTVYRYNIVQGVKRVASVEGAPAPACPASNSSYTYTQMGQIETVTDALGNVTAFTYDDMGRETRRVEASGSSSERITTTTWNGNTFRPETVTTSDRETKYVYDEKGRLVSTTIHSIKE